MVILRDQAKECPLFQVQIYTPLGAQEGYYQSENSLNGGQDQGLVSEIG